MLASVYASAPGSREAVERPEPAGGQVRGVDSGL